MQLLLSNSEILERPTIIKANLGLDLFFSTNATLDLFPIVNGVNQDNTLYALYFLEVHVAENVPVRVVDVAREIRAIGV